MKQRTKRYFAAFLAAAMAFAAVPAPEGKVQAAETNDLIAAYTFTEEDLTDRVIEDTSGNGFDASLDGEGASVKNGVLTLPGGSAGSDAAYVTLPGEIFEGQDTLTITTWLKNETGSNNYSAMFFGTPTKYIGGGTANYPLNYWLLNPAQPSGYFKSVWTDSNNASAPYNTETAVSTTKTSADWGMYTTVITPDSITGYYNGEQVCSSAKTKTTTDFGTGLLAYIGRSSYNDMFYQGGVYGVRVYAAALTEEEIAAEYDQDAAGLDAASLDLGDTSRVTKDLTLPAEGTGGTVITWSSSNPAVVSADGKVTRDGKSDQTVILTAVLTKNGASETKTFTVVVPAASNENLLNEFSVEKLLLEDDIPLQTSVGGSAITWSSSNEAVISIQKKAGELIGVITRPAAGEADVKVTLTAEIAAGTADAAEKSFEVTVRAEDYGYLLAYTNSAESTALGSSLHLAYSQDGADYTALNSNTGICFANNAGGSKNSSPNGLKNMYLFRKADGSYGMAATNVGTNKYIYFFDSENLVDFTNERKLAVGSNVTGGLYVEQYGAENGEYAYKVYWTDGSSQYSALTTDFETVISQGEDFYAQPDTTVTGTLPEGAAACSILGVSKEEYEFVTGKLGVVTNTGIRPVKTAVEAGGSLSEVLPQKVTAEYSDGSTTDMSVEWNAGELAEIDTNKAGTYEVTGTVKQTQYPNPFIEQRADPCILKGNDGYYYFTASYPMCGSSDKDGYDKVVLRRSQTIEGLADAEEITIWDCDDSSDEYRYVWAPEIRLVNDNYYVFYTSSIDSSVWSIRPHVLKCTDPENIMAPESWEAMGQMQAASGDSQAFSGFSLDMTVFENQGRWYVAWAQTDGYSSLFVAEIDKDEPWKCISKCVKISIPEYSWERINENVNEGPSVIKNNGKIYLAFSASGTGPEYCVGLLSIDENADILDASQWKKQAYPVLTSSDVPGEYGPGHNSFTVDEDGNPIFVYHARGQECYDNQCAWASDGSLYDPCRDARLKRVHWAADGTPILKMSYGEELAEENQTVTATITVTDRAKLDLVKENLQSAVLTAEEETIYIGKTTKLSVEYPEGFAEALQEVGMEVSAVSYASSDVSVAKVSKDGVVTGVSEGTAELTAEIALSDGTKQEVSAEVTVQPDRTAQINTVKKALDNKVTAALVTASLYVGETTDVAVNTPDNFDELLEQAGLSVSITYKSSNPSVASVSDEGKVTAAAAGTAIITVTVTLSDGTAKEFTCGLTALKKDSGAPTQKPSDNGGAAGGNVAGGGADGSGTQGAETAVTGVKLNKSKVTLGVKEKFTLTAAVTPANAANQSITWKSSNSKVASVSAAGRVTAKKKGKATITATAGGKTVSCKVTVKAAPKKITLNAKSKSLKKGKTFQIKVKLPKNTASNKITYTSGNKKVATVSASGKVKAVKKGKATITVKTFNGKKATLKVTVK